jgi:hypothetical protein
MASVHDVQLYYNANASDVDLFSIRSDVINWQQQRIQTVNFLGKYADIRNKSMLVIASQPYQALHGGIHHLTQTDMQCLWSQKSGGVT